MAYNTVGEFLNGIEQAGRNDGQKVSAFVSGIKNPEKQSIYGKQLLRGEKIEEEHKDTISHIKKHPEISERAAFRSIAADHLEEDPKYYTHLDDMERKYKAAAMALLRIFQ